MAGYQSGEKIIRLINLIREIAANPNHDCEYYAKKLAVSKRTVYRYINDLEYAGLPIYKKGQNYAFLTVQEGLPEILFESREAIQAWIAISEMGRFLSDTADTSSLIEKFTNSLPLSLQNVVSSFENRVKIYPLSADMPELSQLLLHRVLQAMRDFKTIEILYYSSRAKQETWQRVDPYGLFYRRRGWYLVAYNKEKQLQRIYRLSRIHKLNFTQSTFTLPAGFKLDKAIEQLQKKEVFVLKVRFAPQVAHLLTESSLYAGEQKAICKDGSILYTLKIDDWQKVYYWLLSYGANAEILEPQWLRAKICTEIAKMQNLYKKER